MAIRKHTALSHVSWEELTDMCNSIAGQLRFGKPVQVITPVDDRSAIPAHMIAHKLRCKVGPGGLTFGITSELMPKACFYQFETEKEFFNQNIKTRIRSIPVDIEGEHERFTMPWEK